VRNMLEKTTIIPGHPRVALDFLARAIEEQV